MLRSLVVALVATSLLTGAAVAQDARQLTEAEKVELSRLVQLRLKDPDSARFRWLPKRGEHSVYCGFVNSKNSYGGYVGFVAWVGTVATDADGKVTGKVDRLGDPEAGSYNNRVIRQMCMQKGYELDLAATE